MLNLTSLGAASQGNYTCAGVNYLGVGESASVFLEITGEEKNNLPFSLFNSHLQHLHI